MVKIHPKKFQFEFFLELSYVTNKGPIYDKSRMSTWKRNILYFNIFNSTLVLLFEQGAYLPFCMGPTNYVAGPGARYCAVKQECNDGQVR